MGQSVIVSMADRHSSGHLALRIALFFFAATFALRTRAVSFVLCDMVKRLLAAIGVGAVPDRGE